MAAACLPAFAGSACTAPSHPVAVMLLLLLLLLLLRLLLLLLLRRGCCSTGVMPVMLDAAFWLLLHPQGLARGADGRRGGVHPGAVPCSTMQCNAIG